MDETCREFEYRQPLWVVAFLAGVAVLAVPLSVVMAIRSNIHPPIVAWIGSGSLAVGGVCLAYVSTRMLSGRRRHLTSIRVDSKTILVPRRPSGSAREQIAIPFDAIEEVHVITALQYPRHRQLQVHHRGRRTAILDGYLARKEDLDTLADLLRNRLEPHGTHFLTYDTWFGLRWPRPQISLAAILLMMAEVAAGLGILLMIEPRLRWGLLWALLFLLFVMALPLILMLAGSRQFLICGIGYLLGAVCEFTALAIVIAADLVTFLPGTFAPQGWYPLTLPIERVLLTAGWAETLMISLLLGIVTSGIIGALLSLLLLRAARRLMHRSDGPGEAG